MSMRHWMGLIWILAMGEAGLQGQYAVTLAAGRPGVSGSVDGDLAVARFNQPRGVAVHSASGQVYVVDGSNAVRRYTPLVGVATFAGSLTTAGAVDETGVLARFNKPEGIAVDDGGTVYVADTQNHTIRRITSAGVVTTIAGTAGVAGSFDGIGVSAEFNLPRAIAIGPGGVLYVADSGNHTIRKITFSGVVATVTTLAGQPGLPGNKNGTGVGTASAPQFRNPQGLAVDATGNVFVADTGNHAIRRVTPSGVTTVFAGSVTTSGSVDGTGATARFSQPVGIAIDDEGVLHVGDTGSSALRRITTAAKVTTPAGLLGSAGAANGVGTAARFSSPRGVTVDAAGSIFIADSGNQTLRRAYVPGRLPTITAQPVGVTVAAGQKVVFQVKATGPAPIIYRWQRNGVDLEDEVGSRLTLDAVTEADQGSYQVIVENPWGLVASQAVPLVVTGQASWLWAVRMGGADEDAALDLVVQPAVGTSAESLLVGGRNKGHVLQRHAVARGALLSSAVLDRKGDGVNAVARDASGNVYAGGDSVLVNNGKPGLLVKRSAIGATLWSRLLATERGGNFSPASNADVQGVAVDSQGAAVVTGFFQGSGKFGNAVLGRAASTVNHAFVAKYAANGDVVWARDLFSLHDPANNLFEGESVGWGVMTDAADAVYVVGMMGPNARFQKGVDATEAEDFEAFANVRSTTPFVAKYAEDGTLVWVRMATYSGHFFGLRQGLDGHVWVTGFDGDRVDASQQTAVLEKVSMADGSLAQALRVPGGKGASVDISATQGIAWLVLDPAGKLDYGGRQFGVPGYRCLSVDAVTLGARWDLPVLGALSLAPLALSEQADIRFGAGGLLYAALTFETPSDPKAQVEFPGRVKFGLSNRRTDGFIAAIGELPRIATAPANRMAVLNAATSLTVVPGGFLTPRIQWLRNGAVMAGQTGTTLSFANAQLANAGAYSVRLSNGIDTVTSPVAQLGVVDVAGPGVVPGPINGQVSLSVATAGNGLTYQWRKEGGMLPSGRFSGDKTKVLTLRGLERPGDDGDYVCTVTGPGGNVLVTDPRVLSVKIPPVMNPLVLANGIVSQARSDAATAMNDPAGFVITGLPPGMTFDPVTGLISGRPKGPGVFQVQVTASNVAGRSAPVSTSFSVAALPTGVVGSFAGLIEPNLAINQSLGGRVEMITSSTGAFSGRVTLPSGGESITGVLDVALNGEAKVVVPVGAMTLELTLLPGPQTFSGTLGETPGSSTVVSGWRNVWTAANPATVYEGRWNMGLEIPSTAVGDAAIPQGDGFASLVVSAATGRATVTGRLGEGSLLTSIGFVNQAGEVMVQQFADGGVSSIQGRVPLAVPGTFGGMRWLKGVQAAPMRTYAAGFGPLVLNGQVGKHVVPTAGQILLGLPNASGNARLSLTGGGLTMPLGPVFRITTTHAVVLPVPNANVLTCTVLPLTGQYSGTFEVNDADPMMPLERVTRQGSFNGMVVPGAGGAIGMGAFLLPKLEMTIATAPILSGQATLEAAGP